MPLRTQLEHASRIVIFTQRHHSAAKHTTLQLSRANAMTNPCTPAIWRKCPGRVSTHSVLFYCHYFQCMHSTKHGMYCVENVRSEGIAPAIISKPFVQVKDIIHHKTRSDFAAMDKETPQRGEPFGMRWSEGQVRFLPLVHAAFESLCFLVRYATTALLTKCCCLSTDRATRLVSLLWLLKPFSPPVSKTTGSAWTSSRPSRRRSTLTQTFGRGSLPDCDPSLYHRWRPTVVVHRLPLSVRCSPVEGILDCDSAMPRAMLCPAGMCSVVPWSFVGMAIGRRSAISPCTGSTRSPPA
jgi:hypothetical protein